MEDGDGLKTRPILAPWVVLRPDVAACCGNPSQSYRWANPIIQLLAVCRYML